MPGYLYPPAAPAFTGDVQSIHRLLQRPAVVAKRLQDLLTQRYIADAILKGRFQVIGGAVAYETGEPIGTEANPRAIAPGGEYPIVDLGGGVVSTAKTTKWGEDVPIYDESIARMLIRPVDVALTRLANQNVMYIDGVAMAVVATAITNSTAAPAVFANMTAEQILTLVMTTRARVRALDFGDNPNTVVLDDLAHATVMAKFIAAGYLPRESRQDNPVVTGDFPSIMGFTWLPTNHGLTGQALVVDSDTLGGMADEDLGSPGYARSTAPGTTGVETKVIRDDDKDRYKARARRVTVPVVTNPAAGWKITGVS